MFVVRRPLGLLLPLTLVLGCGSSLKPPEPTPGIDGGGITITDGGTGDGMIAMLDMRGYNQQGSPEITILAPASGAEISGGTLTVSARITSPSSTPIYADSVNVSIVVGGKTRTSALFVSADPAVYNGNIDISDVPSGEATFDVAAADTAARKASVTGKYIHDRGPVIKFTSPTNVAYRDAVSVEFTVEDARYPVTDISQVTAGIRAKDDIALTVAGTNPLRVKGTLYPNLFNPPLDGAQIITATARNSKGTVGQKTQDFRIDNAGPQISNIVPDQTTYVGGVVTISATITDGVNGSGVDDTTVKAVFANDPVNHSVALAKTGQDTYAGRYDVGVLGTSFVFLTMSIRASDKAGNLSQVGYELVVDNTRPYLTMNSLITMRVADPAGVCSKPFSPIGEDAASEGLPVERVLTVRARVEDRGNTAPGLKVLRYSGLRKEHPPTLYAIPMAGNLPLAVDTDNDGFCDDVNPTLIPTSSVTMSGQALALEMAPIGLGGKPWYLSDSSTPPAGCAQLGNDPSAAKPAPLCTLAQTKLYYVLPWDNREYDTSIFTLPPVRSNPYDCVGFQLDSLNSLPEGPTCFIVRAADATGNVNVSYPLHLCIKGPQGLCNTFTYSPTACTGVYDKMQQKIVPGTCAEGPTFPKDGTEVRPLAN